MVSSCRPALAGVLGSLGLAILAAGPGSSDAGHLLDRRAGRRRPVEVVIAGDRVAEAGEGDVDRGVLRAARVDLHAERHQGLAVHRDVHRADPGPRVLRGQHQDVGGPAGHHRVPIGTYRGGRVDQGQRLLGGLARGDRRQLLRCGGLGVGRQRGVAGRPGVGVPLPQLAAVAEYVLFTELIQQRDPLLVLAGVPDPGGVRAAEQSEQAGGGSPRRPPEAVPAVPARPSRPPCRRSRPPWRRRPRPAIGRRCGWAGPDWRWRSRRRWPAARPPRPRRPGPTSATPVGWCGGSARSWDRLGCGRHGYQDRSAALCTA